MSYQSSTVRQVKITGLTALTLLLLACLRGGSETTPVADPPLQALSAPPVLLELFTSQGCSSCPPADAVLQRLVEESDAGERNVIALSYHVDYWNRLGWKDPYSQAAFSERQREYARRLPEHRVYTPQLVVQGRNGHVGSREREVRTAIARAAAVGAATQIEVAAQADGTLFYTLTGRTEDLRLHVATVAGHRVNDVARGENRGRRLEHANVVLDLQTHRAPATRGTLTLDPATLEEAGEGVRVVLFVQDVESWEVLGAVEVIR